MKIVSIQSHIENLKLVRPYKIATKLISDVENVIVTLTLSDGTIGYGAASPAENVTGESITRCARTVQDYSSSNLIGESLESMSDLETLCKKLCNDLTYPNAPKEKVSPAASAALDIALHDAFANVQGKPLVELFGQQHVALPTSITIGIKNVAATLAEAHEYIDREFSILKVKLGDNVIEDIARLKALRAEFGNTIKIRVDMNQGHDLSAFTRFLDETADLDIELMEQPFTVIDTPEIMTELTVRQRALIALDESLVSIQHARDLAKVAAPGIFNIKLMKCGGLYAARQIAAIAKAANIDLMWGCNDESRISISAALHAAFACAHTKYIDLDGSLDLAKDVVTAGFTIDKGIMKIVEHSGLGLSASL